MGLLSTRWEADWEGVHITVQRNEVTKGFAVECDGRVIDERRWSWAGSGKLSGEFDHNGRRSRIKVALPLSFPRPKCQIEVDGAPITVRQVK